MKPLILFVDDEERFVRSYIDELRLSGFEVEFCSGVDSALAFFSSHREQVGLCVLDIMMSAGNAFGSADTQGGIRTGLLLYNHIRQQAPSLPLFVLTNRISEEVKDRVDTDNHGRLFRKDQSFPVDLANDIRDMLDFGGD